MVARESSKSLAILASGTAPNRLKVFSYGSDHAVRVAATSAPRLHGPRRPQLAPTLDDPRG